MKKTKIKKDLSNKIKKIGSGSKIRGITLISLIITIVVLLILAAITLNLVLGDNGILRRARTARDESEIASATEKLNIKITSASIKSYAENKRMPTLKELADNFCEDDDFEYVEEQSKRASLNKISSDNPEFIYTKLKEYPYEFQIDSELRLAKVDGEPVDTRKQSNIITALEVECTVEGTKIELTANTTATDNAKILGYHYFLIEKANTENIIAKISENNSVKFNNLNPETEYLYYCAAYDIENNYVETQIEETETDRDQVTFLDKYDKYIYIDANNGDDSTGDGTSQNPYKTLAKIAGSGIIQNNFSYGIILRNGTYTLTDSLFNMTTCNRSINIIGNRQNTIISATRIGTYSSWTGNTNYSVNFYRLVWDGNNRSDTNTISMQNAITLNQVLLKRIGNSTYGYFISSRDTYFNNCTLMGTPGGFISYYHSSKILTNCYGYFSVGETGSHSFTKTTCYITSSPHVNETTYQLTESNESTWKNAGTGTNPDGTVANIGVYGGTYSWEFGDDIF